MTATSSGHWVRVQNWVFRTAHLDPFEVKVYGLLLSRADAKGKAWPSRRGIAADTGISEGKVKKALARLEALGLVTVSTRHDDAGGQMSNLYRVRFDASEPTLTAHHPVTPHHDVTPSHGKMPGPSFGSPAPGSPGDDKEYPDQENPDEEHPSSEVAATPQRDKAEKKTIWWATPTQLSYLSDLTILAGEQPPTQAQIDHWIEHLTAEQASDRIDDYLQAIGRGIDYAGPHEGDPEYERLSDTGKAFADAEMLPDN